MSTQTRDDYVDVTDVRAAEAQLAAELQKLEEIVAAEVPPSVTKAVEAFQAITLTPTARKLLDDSCDNVSNNRGVGLTGSAQQEAISRATLFKACNGDLSAVIDALTRSTGESERGGVIYSTIYAVQKAAVFVANLMYRTRLDRRADEDLPMNVDSREDFRDAPYGLEPDPDPLLAERAYAGDGAENVVLDALSELHVYLGLLVEMYGWDPDRPMPYLVYQAKDGAFIQVHDAQAALDIMEIRRQESRARSQERRATSMKRASELALAAVKAGLARKA